MRQPSSKATLFHWHWHGLSGCSADISLMCEWITVHSVSVFYKLMGSSCRCYSNGLIFRIYTVISDVSHYCCLHMHFDVFSIIQYFLPSLKSKSIINTPISQQHTLGQPYCWHTKSRIWSYNTLVSCNEKQYYNGAYLRMSTVITENFINQHLRLFCHIM